MTEAQTIQSISVNLLRMAQWYYTNPDANRALCQRYLEQSQQLAEKVTAPAAQAHLNRLAAVNFTTAAEPTAHTAERCLTIAVLLQKPPIK